MFLRSGHTAERVSESAANREDRQHSIKFVKGVGFSKGCAELVLKKPPPFVPNSLMNSCEATGP